jgi:hypothetical protein
MVEFFLDFKHSQVQAQPLLQDLLLQVGVGDVELASAISELCIFHIIGCSDVLTQNSFLALAHVSNHVKRVTSSDLVHSTGGKVGGD